MILHRDAGNTGALVDQFLPAIFVPEDIRLIRLLPGYKRNTERSGYQRRHHLASSCAERPILMGNFVKTAKLKHSH
jgi:hypothetical protein